MAQFRIKWSDGSRSIVVAQRMLRVGDDLLFSEPEGHSWRTVAVAPLTEVLDLSTVLTEYVAVDRWTPVSIPAPGPDDLRSGAFG